MKSAVATRLCCRRPLTDLEQLTPMFLTLILQYLNELVEGKVGDLSPPQAFHTLKVQGFNRNCVKPLTEFTCESPMKVFALVGDFPIKACELSHTLPPAIRTFLFTAQCFVERPKFVQGVLQRLWVLFFLTRAKCQICVFHTEVCPNTLTRCGQKFAFYKICYDIQPIVTTSVSLNCDTTNFPIKLSVLVERIWNSIISPLTSVPFPEGKGDTIIFQRPTCLFQRKGLEPMPFLDTRSTPKSLEKTDIRCVNTSQLLLDRLTRQCFPMWVCCSFQIRQVGRHSVIVRIRQPDLISLALPLMEILVDLPHIVKQVAKTNTIGLIAKLIFIRFHGISSIRFPLTPNEWVGRHATLRLRSLCLST